MKAIVYTEYGSPDVLKFAEIPKPTAKDNEVLIKVRSASVNPIDWHFMRGSPYFIRIMTGLGKPKVQQLGSDVAGEVEAVGRNVTLFKPGDAVFGTCRGSLAEYVCARESTVFRKMPNTSFEQAASVGVAGYTALQGLRDKGHIQAGQNVLINGASGGVGTFAVQLAKWFGTEVTGVCSTRNVDRVRSIGADLVIDHTREDFSKSEKRYDLILDCYWDHPLSACRRVLKPKGNYIIVGGPSDQPFSRLLFRLVRAVISSMVLSRKFVMFVAKSSVTDLQMIGELIESGKVKPVIDRYYSLSEVPEAIRYLEEGHARGKVVITIA